MCVWGEGGWDGAKRRAADILMVSLTSDLWTYLPSGLWRSVRSESQSGTTTSRLTPSLLSLSLPSQGDRFWGTRLGPKGGVWLCVWMGLVCKHWASVIWWHMKGVCLWGGRPIVYMSTSPTMRTHTHTHRLMPTLTPDLCIYALRRHSSKGYGWRGLGGTRCGARLFGLQTETDGVLGGDGWAVYMSQKRLMGRRRHLESDDSDS